MLEAVSKALAAAASGSDSASKYIKNGGTVAEKNYDGTDLMSTVQVIVNVALAVIGVLAVIMIILGGVQYTTSSGDAGKVKKAKDTIMYGIIGLVVALLAFAIVNFVLTNIFK